MSIFYPGELIIFGLSVNSFIPFNVENDILAKVRKNFFQHNRRQSDKLVQNIGEVSIKYNYSLERNKPMKWIVQKNKRTIEDVVIVSVNSYEIRTYNNNGEKLIATEYTNEHIFKKVTFNLNNETVSITSGKENDEPALFYFSGGKKEILYMLEIDEDENVLSKLSEINPFITVTALTNRGLVYFGSQEEINSVRQVIEEVKKDILAENQPKVYISENDKLSGFNFKDNDFNIKKNMNQTYNIDKVDYFDTTDELVEATDYNSDEELKTPDNNLDTPDEKADKSESAEYFNEELTENEVPSVDFSYINKELDFQYEELSNGDLSENNSVSNSIENSNPMDNPDLVNDASKNSQDVNSEKALENKEILEKLLLEKISEALKSVNVNTSEKEKIDFANSVDISSIIKDNLDEEDFSLQKDNEGKNDNRNVKTADLIINSGGERYLYFGELNENLVRHGYGRTEMTNGKTAYEGYYKDNKRCGFGSFYYRDGGLCYTGEWNENKREGFGVGTRTSDNSFHVGGWSNNKPEGVGARFDKYGNLSYITNYEKGKEKGLCVEFNSDGSVTVFKWQNDEKKIIETIYP